MTLFSNAAWKDMSPALWRARSKAEELHLLLFQRFMTITSGRRPATVGGSSRHETGDAMDIRVREPDGSWEMSPDEQRTFTSVLSRLLGEDYDVIVEGAASPNPRYQDRAPHIHVEYDPKGRHRYG